jgi:hypothetical protein
MGGYYVYSYNDVCVLVELDTRDNECGQQLFPVKISHRDSCIRKKGISYSHARVYIFFLEVDVTIYQEQLEASGASRQRVYSNHTVKSHQLCTFIEHDLQKLKIKHHFIPKPFSPITTLHIASCNITNSYYDFCHVWWT